MKRVLLFVLLVSALVTPVRAETIRWVDFDVPYESMKYALDQDILTAQQEKHISWVDALALAACRTEKTPEEKERERLALEAQRMELEGLQNMMSHTGFPWKNGGKSQ